MPTTAFEGFKSGNTIIPVKDVNALPRSEQAVLGAKNLLRLTNDSQTVQTVSVEVDKAAGKVTLNGTNTTGSALYKTVAQFTSGDTVLKHGMQVIFSGYNNVNTVMYINGLKQDDTYTYNVANSSPDLHEQSFIVDWTTYKRYDVGITLKNDVTYDNDVVCPMIRLASDPDDTFASPAMTNKELTEKVFEKSVLTDADDLNDIVKTGLYHIRQTPTNAPDSITYATLIVSQYDESDIQQLIFKAENIYVRRLGGYPASWQSWYKFTGTVVS